MPSEKQNSPIINIEVKVGNGEPHHEHYGAIMLAFVRCLVSVTKKIGATNPYATADAVRDDFLIAWENAPKWPEAEQ